VTVSLLEILAAARAHAAPLAAESAGYLLLAVADHLVAAPRATTADEVELMTDGSVRLRARRSAGPSDEQVEQAVRRLLARTLEVSSGVGPALRRAAERRQDTGLTALVRELETALIPVNRSAARRALSRLHRETERARDAGKLDALLQAEQAPAAPAASPPEQPADAVALAAEFPEASPVVLPVVTAAPAPAVVPAPAAAPMPAAPTAVAAARSAAPKPAPVSAPVLTLTPLPAASPAPAEFTPEPLLAVGEPALTKPEPVVLRKKERGSATPRLGTVVTAQTLPGDESEHTLRAPPVSFDEECELDVHIEVELEAALSELSKTVSPPAPQALLDPEPSTMPDVLTAMVALHTGVDADEAPTRIRDVVTELRVTAPPVLRDAPPVLTPEPELVDDAWLTQSSLDGVVSAPARFESELAEPAVHEAVTWNPGPVAPSGVGGAPAAAPAFVLLEVAPEPSPYAPAVLPVRSSDVSELLDSFHVTAAAEERELRSALKEMAGLSLTPMPLPIASEG